MSAIDPDAASSPSPDPSAMDPPRGLALNSARLICPGRHLVTKFVKPHQYERTWKRTLERELRQSVFVGESFAYVSGEIEDPRGRPDEVDCQIEDGALHLFDLRSALANQARQQGLDAWFSFGGVINIAGLPGERLVGDIAVRPRLRLRVVSEGWSEPETFVVARPRSRWLLTGSLTDLRNPQSFVGETAERIGGDGPRRGKIEAFDSSGSVVIRNRDEQSSWPCNDYTVVATPPLVRQRYGADIFTQLQIASGALSKTKRKNLYTVKDRFTAAAAGLAEIGHALPMPNGETAVIESAWTEVRVQEGS